MALAFVERGTYNPASRDEGQPSKCFNRATPSLPGPPARKPGIPKQDPTHCGPDGMQLLLRCIEHDSQSKIFPELKEPY